MPAPKVATMRAASTGPMPLTSPEARNFSMPLAEAGRVIVKWSTLNWRPKRGLSSQPPRMRRTSPGESGGKEPTTVSVSPPSVRNLATV